MEPTIVLIPSPLLGPASWEPTAQVLRKLGRRVRVADLRCVAEAAPPYWPAGVEAITNTAGEEPVVLVPHSNSGLYLPAAVDALEAQVRGVVFVDAALPQVGFHASRDFLNTLVREDGRLPPWTAWWGDADVGRLFPNAEVRSRVEAEQPRMPLAYYDHVPPVTEGWDRLPCAYVWFGEPYDRTAATASALGWTTVHVPGQHVHTVVDPDAVAAAIADLVDGMR